MCVEQGGKRSAVVMMGMQRHRGNIAEPQAVDLASSALLLDVDGTLIDIAPSPDDVHVPDGLKRTLHLLLERTNGAVALVSGRRITELDALFDPLRIAAIGCHGAEMRVNPAGLPVARAPVLPQKVRQAYSDIAVLEPLVRVEDKTFSLAFHYRQVVDREPRILALVRGRAAAFTPELTLLHGKAVVEVKTSGVNKGEAVLELMRHAPFAGRSAVFLGDDRTDEDVFAVLHELGGFSVSVGRKAQDATFMIKSPADVRRWLATLTSSPPDTRNSGSAGTL